MMRIVVLVLVAANLLYLVWAQTSGNESRRLTAVESAAATTSEAAPPPVTPELAAAAPCATVGPFTDELSAEQARQQLEAARWGVVRRTWEEELPDGWWVYVANEDAQGQTRALNAIRNAGMRDAFAMPDDPQFRVSVGIFSREERAEDRAMQVQRLRYDARVVERRKQQQEIWLDVPGVARETLSDGRLEATGLPLARLRIEDCPVDDPAPDADAASAQTEEEPVAP